MDTIKVENGKLTVLKGKMAAGKSMAMLIDAKDYIDFKMGVLFFSLEQSSAKIYDKFFDKVKAKKEHGDCMHIVDSAFSLKALLLQYYYLTKINVYLWYQYLPFSLVPSKLVLVPKEKIY